MGGRIQCVRSRDDSLLSSNESAIVEDYAGKGNAKGGKVIGHYTQASQVWAHNQLVPR